MCNTPPHTHIVVVLLVGEDVTHQPGKGGRGRVLGAEGTARAKAKVKVRDL